MKQNKIVYVFEHPIEGLLGLQKKAIGQLKAFKSLGFSPYFVYIKASSIVIYDYENDKYETEKFNSDCDYYEKAYQFIENMKPEILYIRKRTLMNYFSLKFYEKCSKICNEMKCVIEFPTIPYDGQVKPPDKHRLDMDKYYREHLKDCFKYSTNFNDFDEVFGIPSVKLINGIDMNSVKLKKKREVDGKINLISPSSMCFWNGYERILYGLRNYYDNKENKENIYLYLVGDGEETGFYKSLTKELNLSEYVFFYGNTYGEQLNELLDMADIGVISLGLYKIKLTQASPIRTSEYLSAGLPCIYAFDNLSITDGFKYALNFPNDESAIDMNKIVEFYNSVNKDEHFNSRIREHCSKYLSWNAQMEKTLKFIQH